MEVIFTDRFLNRVEEYSDYIALDDISGAKTWASEALDQCRQLKKHPQSGRVVPEFSRPEIRELIHGKYRLIYEIKTNKIDMLTIWHTSQQLPDEFE